MHNFRNSTKSEIKEWSQLNKMCEGEEIIHSVRMVIMDSIKQNCAYAFKSDRGLNV